MNKTFIGPFIFQPWVKINSLAQINDALGPTQWHEVCMTYKQLEEYSFLLPPQGLATEVNGIPITIYGSCPSSLPPSS